MVLVDGQIQKYRADSRDWGESSSRGEDILAFLQWKCGPCGQIFTAPQTTQARITTFYNSLVMNYEKGRIISVHV